MIRKFCVQLMSIVFVMAICHSQIDYLFGFEMGSNENFTSKSDGLNDLFDGDDESSDQDENQKEGKSYPLFVAVLPQVGFTWSSSSTSKCGFGCDSESWMSNPYLAAIYQPPRQLSI